MNAYSITNLKRKTLAVIADPKYFLSLQEAYENYLDTTEYDAGKKSLSKNKAIPFNQI